MPNSRRVLILTTTFFPDPSVGGVRMTQWARCLPELGWKPHILARYYGYYATRELIETKLHPSVQVEYLNPPAQPPADGEAGHATTSGAPTLASKLKRVVGQSALNGLFVPDTGIKFWRSVRPRVLARVQDIKPHLIITTGPPHSNHDIGMWLKERTGIPWVADFRDPYVTDPRFAPRAPVQWMWPFHDRYARSVYSQADLITHAIPIQARWWRMRMPGSRPRIRILTNACAPDLALGKVEPARTSSPRKSIRVIGMIEDEEATRLARAVADLVRSGRDLELRLVGGVPGSATDIIRALGERAVFTRGLRHDLALAQVAGADVLVNYLSAERSTHTLLSSKLFEYIASGNPIIEINPTLPDKQMLRQVRDPIVMTAPTHDQLVHSLARALDMDRAALVAGRKEFVETHEWRSHVKLLSEWFGQIVGASAQPSTPHEPAPISKSRAPATS